MNPFAALGVRGLITVERSVRRRTGRVIRKPVMLLLLVLENKNLIFLVGNPGVKMASVGTTDAFLGSKRIEGDRRESKRIEADRSGSKAFVGTIGAFFWGADDREGERMIGKGSG